jgi:RNA polymerase sigma-70 factor (ECF subfamily)
MDEQSFEVFYRETVTHLRNYVVRAMGGRHADDVVQDAFLRLLRHPPQTEVVEELRAYLFRIASNLMTDRWRRQQRERDLADTPAAESSHVDSMPSLDMERTFVKLRPVDRQLLWLAYVEGESHRDIAVALGFRERSIRVLLSRARARLLELLGTDPPTGATRRSASSASDNCTSAIVVKDR